MNYEQSAAQARAAQAQAQARPPVVPSMNDMRDAVVDAGYNVKSSMGQISGQAHSLLAFAAEAEAALHRILNRVRDCPPSPANAITNSPPPSSITDVLSEAQNTQARITELLHELSDRI